MACLLQGPLLLLTTLTGALKLSLSPVLIHTLLSSLEHSSLLEHGGQESQDYANTKYNENNYDLYLSWVVEMLRVQKQIFEP